METYSQRLQNLENDAKSSLMLIQKFVFNADEPRRRNYQFLSQNDCYISEEDIAIIKHGWIYCTCEDNYNADYDFERDPSNIASAYMTCEELELKSLCRLADAIADPTINRELRLSDIKNIYTHYQDRFERIKSYIDDSIYCGIHSSYLKYKIVVYYSENGQDEVCHVNYVSPLGFNNGGPNSPLIPWRNIDNIYHLAEIIDNLIDQNITSYE